jgi:glucosamine--fructose-6-phosphate aminotransferase (isomerizing)
MSMHEPDLILAARLGHAGAIVIGEGEGEQFVASDMPAILDYTQRMVFLEDQEIAILRPGKVEYRRLDNTPIDKPSQHVAWDPVAAVKGGYRHFMLKEIFEQPRSITDTIHDRIDLEEGRVYLPDLRMSDDELREVDRIYTVACGTAWHAGLIGKFLIESLAGVRVEVDYGSEFRYRDPLLDERTVLMVVTQSGETADTLAGMAIARAAGVKSIGIVNAVGSQVARIADGGVVYLNAGIEISVASTKAFTCMVVAQYLLALKLAQVRGRLSPDQIREQLGELLTLPNKIGAMLEETAIYERLAERFRHTTDMLFLGRGINYPIALEGALKLKELSYIHAEGYPAGEMKHGPIALIDDEMPVVCIAPADALYDKMLSQVEQAQARGGQVIAIVTEGDTVMRSKADWVIEVPATHPLLTPVLTVIPLQLLAYYVAVDRGADVDQPRNLAKSVTVE